MKEIKSASFSVQRECDANKTEVHVKRMPPSGSGSEETIKGNDYGGGHGSVSSSFGGSWDVSCSFRWSSELTYEKVEDMNAIVVTKAVVTLSNIVVSCRSVPAGTTVNGKYYEPFNHGMNVGSDGRMKESSMGLHDITWSTNTSEEEFKVVVREYDKNGKEISSIIKTEKKRIGMEFIFLLMIPVINLR